MVDQERFAFDELAKGLAGGTVSRRKVLRLLGAAFVGTTLASVPGMAWAAKTPRPPKPDGRCSQNKPCPAGQGCCNRTCVDLQSDPNNCGSCGNSCPEGVPCTNGGCVVCVQPEFPDNCNGECVDLQSDPNNCGSCGHSCSSGEFC